VSGVFEAASVVVEAEAARQSGSSGCKALASYVPGPPKSGLVSAGGHAASDSPAQICTNGFIYKQLLMSPSGRERAITHCADALDHHVDSDCSVGRVGDVLRFLLTVTAASCASSAPPICRRSGLESGSKFVESARREDVHESADLAKGQAKVTGRADQG